MSCEGAGHGDIHQAQGSGRALGLAGPGTQAGPSSAHTHTFSLKASAETWAKRVEREMEAGIAASSAEAEATTLGEALKRYAAEIIPRKRHSHREYLRVEM